MHWLGILFISGWLVYIFSQIWQQLQVVIIDIPYRNLPRLRQIPWIITPNLILHYQYPQTITTHIGRGAIGIFLIDYIPILLQARSVVRKSDGQIYVVCAAYVCVISPTILQSVMNIIAMLSEIPILPRVTSDRWIYTLAANGVWTKKIPRKSRTLSSIILDSSTKNSISQIMRSFLNSEEWYQRQEIPYRLGIALYGPSGNGKTSLVEALSNEFGTDIYYLDLVKCVGKDISSIIQQIPKKQIILIEDLELIAKNIDSSLVTNVERANNLILTNLLDVMDGIFSQTGSIIIVTSSRYNDIPREFKEAGRFDRIFNIGNPGALEIAEYFTKFYGIGLSEEDRNALPAQATQFAEQLTDFSVPMREIQRYLISHRDHIDTAIAEARAYFREMEKNESQ